MELCHLSNIIQIYSGVNYPYCDLTPNEFMINLRICNGKIALTFITCSRLTQKVMFHFHIAKNSKACNLHCKFNSIHLNLLCYLHVCVSPILRITSVSLPKKQDVVLCFEQANLLSV